MADKKEYKVAPRVALTSKGGIIDDGTVVTAENFASETVFNELVKKGKIVTSEDYIKKVDELNNPEKAAENAKKAAEAEAKKKAEEEAKKAAEAEAKKKAEEEAKKAAEAEAKKKAEEEAKKAAQNGNNGGNK